MKSDEARYIRDREKVVFEVHPLLQLVPRMGEDVYARLKSSIDSVGLREPILVDKENRIVDGRARARACIELEILDANTAQAYPDDDIATLVSTKVIRSDYTSAQLAVLAAGLWEPFRAEARKRRAAGNSKAKNDELVSKESADQVAWLVGSNNCTFARPRS